MQLTCFSPTNCLLVSGNIPFKLFQLIELEDEEEEEESKEKKSTVGMDSSINNWSVNSGDTANVYYVWF